MRKKRAKELKKIAVAFALMNPKLNVREEYKKLKSIHKESNKNETKRP